MKASTSQVLNLFFNAEETICVSPSKFGFHSIKQSDIENPTLITPKGKVFDIYEDQINLLCVNPVNGFRKDENVTALRSFLIECDNGPLSGQKAYIETMQMPYSICVYSGNKSLHFGLVLDQDLGDLKIWKYYCEWILNIMSLADQQTNNPTRSIRFPGNQRLTEPFKMQSLVDIRQRVKLDDLNIWLNRFPDKKPKPIIKQKTVQSAIITARNIPQWIKDYLENGIITERNKTWYRIAAHFAERGTEEEIIVEFLDNFFVEESDFTRNEWLVTINSAFKKANL
jgi:hypothetical protein